MRSVIFFALILGCASSDSLTDSEVAGRWDFNELLCGESTITVDGPTTSIEFRDGAGIRNVTAQSESYGYCSATTTFFYAISGAMVIGRSPSTECTTSVGISECNQEWTLNGVTRLVHCPDDFQLQDHLEFEINGLTATSAYDLDGLECNDIYRR